MAVGRVKVVINTPALNNMLKGPQGEVAKYLRKRGRLMMALAKQQVGKDTGLLKSSIHMRVNRDSVGLVMEIGSDLGYAHAHHEGTKPHVITPKEAGILRFSSGSRIIYSRHVNHPGTRPNRYLSDQLWVAKI